MLNFYETAILTSFVSEFRIFFIEYFLSPLTFLDLHYRPFLFLGLRYRPLPFLGIRYRPLPFSADLRGKSFFLEKDKSSQRKVKSWFWLCDFKKRVIVMTWLFPKLFSIFDNSDTFIDKKVKSSNRKVNDFDFVLKKQVKKCNLKCVLKMNFLNAFQILDDVYEKRS